jgi:Secretion system C-terminal sorting domain
MKMKMTMLFAAVLWFAGSNGQLIQTTVKKGAVGNDVDVFLKPNFSSSTEYMLQLQFAIAFPASVSPLPSSITVTLHPNFVSTFVGNTYNILVNPMGTSTGNTEKYFSILMTRNAGTPVANSTAQTWVSGTEYPVMNVRFNSPSSPPAQAQIKIADYQDQGSDLNGNTFVVNGTGTYYYDFGNSAANFYTSAGQSVAGGNASAGFVQTVALVSLPVNLLNFSGYKNGSKNTLKWTTANENNNVGFEVQRSLDGVDYNEVGFVNTQAAGGTSSTSLSYVFDDNSPAGKKQYYRLRQIDMDAHAKLSNIVLIKEDKQASLFNISGIFPNPARETINVMINTPRKNDITLIIMDAAGKTVKQKVANVDTGSNTISVDIANLASGSYVIKMICKTSDCETEATKFNKQ